MSKTNSTVRELKPQTLTTAEIQRIADKLSASLQNDSEDLALLTLLLDHLEQVRTDQPTFSGDVYNFKNQLFINTSEGCDAQQQFQADAFKNRGKLLRWPGKRSAS